MSSFEETAIELLLAEVAKMEPDFSALPNVVVYDPDVHTKTGEVLPRHLGQIGALMAHLKDQVFVDNITDATKLKFATRMALQSILQLEIAVVLWKYESIEGLRFCTDGTIVRRKSNVVPLRPERGIVDSC